MPVALDLEGLKKLLDEGAQLVDVLPADEFEDDHLPDALNLPLTELDAEAAARLDRDRPVVVYCHDSQ